MRNGVFYLTQKETTKLQNILNGNYSKYKFTLVDDVEVTLIRKIGVCNGRSNPDDGYYLYLSKDGNVYIKYLHTFYGGEYCKLFLAISKSELLKMEMNKTYDFDYKVEINDKYNTPKVHDMTICIELYKENPATDIENNIIQIGDTIVGAVRSYGGASLVKGVVAKITETLIILNDGTKISRGCVYLCK